MIRRCWRPAAAGLLFSVVAAQARAGAEEFARPPFSGAYEPQGVDERGLWMEMDEAERAFRDSPGVLRNDALNAYLRRTLCNAVGEERCAAVRIYVVKDASFNASMAPNGQMIVHTGLLARMLSEAELAAVLGHEFAHFERRHSLNGFRKQRSTNDAIAWISLAGAVTGTRVNNTNNALIFAYFQYSRDQEAEADALSVRFLRASPYRLRASRTWQRVIDEENALRAERGLRKIRRNRPGLLDTHPAALERVAFNAKQEAEAGDRGEDGAERYREATGPVLRELIEPLIKGNEFGGADYVLRMRGEAFGWDAQLYFLRGELYRQRGYPRDLVTARDFFQKSVDSDQAPPESWRGLGLCAMRLGDMQAGRAALSEYLKRMPGAPDVAAIKLLVEN